MIFQNFNFAPYGVEPFLPGVRDYVEEGGAIAMIGGDLSFASGGYGSTALRDVLPVELPPSPPGVAGGGDADLTVDSLPTQADRRGARAPGDLAGARPARERGALGQAAGAGGREPRAARAARRGDAAGPPDAARPTAASRRRCWWWATRARGARWRC